jgi:hypothetical protein
MDDFRPAVLWRFWRMRWQLACARLIRDLAVWSDIRAFPPSALLAGLNCVSVLIVMRQRSGGLPLTLSNWRLCVAAVAAAGLTIGSRWLLTRIEREPPAFRIRVFLAAVSVFPLIVLLTVATPRNSITAIGFVSLLAVVAGNANLLWSRRHSAPPETLKMVSEPRLVETPPAVVRVVPEAAPEPFPTHPAGCEWTERTCGERRELHFRGSVSASFAAGQSLTTVHIPFIPAFPCIPEFTCQIIDQPAVRSRTPVVYRYGVRIELKRTGSVLTPLDVAVEFRATQAIASRAA